MLDAGRCGPPECCSSESRIPDIGRKVSCQTPTISFVSLGYSKNLVDSERMLGLLGQDGYVLVPERSRRTWL